MKNKKTKLEMPTILSVGSKLFVDDRGELVIFPSIMNFKNIKRAYIVRNHTAGFVRAWHGHYREGKYVTVIRGAAIIGLAPLDFLNGKSHESKSSAYNIEPLRTVLSDNHPTVIFIPPGWGNGAKNLTKDTEIMYFSDKTVEESKNDDIRFEWNAIPDFWTVQKR